MNLNIFENMALIDCTQLFSVPNLSLFLNGVCIPGNIAFNTPWLLLSNTQTGTFTRSISLGLYTRTGSTLTLVNSASGTTTISGAGTACWISLATSAASTITPGNYWFGVLASFTSGNPSLFGAQTNVVAIGTLWKLGAPGGLFVRGCLSVSTTALPSSIATADCLKEGGSTVLASTYMPYILISA